MGRIIVIEDNIIYSDYEDDIVLADMRLPDGDGIALLEELRKSRAGTIPTSS